MYLTTLFGVALALSFYFEGGETTAATTTTTTSPLANATNDFALALYNKISAQNVGQNMFFATSSISTCLAMLYIGSAGKTKTQMTTTLRYNKISGYDNNNYKLNKMYQSFLTSPDLKGKNNYTLAMANGLFSGKGSSIKQTYVNNITTYYLSKVEQLDFKDSPDASRTTINTWVAQNTNNRIPELFGPGSITSGTTLVLVNAIFFQGTWQTIFNNQNTAPTQFSVSATQQVTVQMMNLNEKYFPYYSASNYQMLELPYIGGTISMYIILPTAVDGLSAIEKSLTAATLFANIQQMTTKEITSLGLPRFAMNEAYTLNPYLMKLGMTDAFNAQKADFSNIYTTWKGQAVTTVVHKAFINVTETGTEAAGATGIGVGVSFVTTPIYFVCDHPFMFLIVDKPSGIILFVGRVTSPTSG